MDKTKLEPCPFCGKSDSVVLLSEGERLHYVYCSGHKGGCGARTTLCEQEKTAVLHWNGRAPLPDSKALTVFTRADGIRAMTDVELAAWIIYLQEHEISEKWCDSAKCLRRINAQEELDCTDEMLVACVARWLGQAEED